jgi:hypothetical protein
MLTVPIRDEQMLLLRLRRPSSASPTIHRGDGQHLADLVFCLIAVQANLADKPLRLALGLATAATPRPADFAAGCQSGDMAALGARREPPRLS